MNDELARELTTLAKEQAAILARLTKALESATSRLTYLEAVSLAQRGAIYSLISCHQAPSRLFSSFADYLDLQLEGASPDFMKLVQAELQRIQAQIVQSANAQSQGD